MTDPPRLLESGSAEAELLEAWASQRAPSGARARALAGLGAGAAASAVAAKTAALGGAKVTAATGAGLFATKWLIAVGVVAAVGGTSLVVHHYASATPVTMTPAPLPVPMPVPPVTAESITDADEPSAPPTTVAAPNASLAPRVHVAHVTPRATTTAPPAKPSPASSLAGEVASLDSARAALRSGQASASLHELDAFDAHYPDSALAEDAAFLRFDAYVALGDRAGATRSANAVLATYASSPRAAKVRRWLDDAQR